MRYNFQLNEEKKKEKKEKKTPDMLRVFFVP